MPSQIDRAIKQTRAEIDARETAVVRRVVKAWRGIRLELTTEIEDYTKAVESRLKNGEPYIPQYEHTTTRYKSYIEQVGRIISKFADNVEGDIIKAKRDNYAVGVDSADELVRLTIGGKRGADSDIWTRVNVASVEATLGATADGSPLHALFRRDFKDTADSLETVLMRSVAVGRGWKWTADQMMLNATNLNLVRATRIARTEINRAYREGTLAQYRNMDFVKGYRRRCYKETACFACLMMDGEYYDINQAFSDHPNGKCCLIPVTKYEKDDARPNWQTGREWFDSLSEDEQRAIMGKKRFELMKEFNLDPRAMVWLKPSEVWGPQPQNLSISAILEGLNNVPPAYRDTAMETIRNSDWYKQIAGVSEQARQDLETAFDRMPEDRLRVWMKHQANLQGDFGEKGHAEFTEFDNSVHMDINSNRPIDRLNGYKSAIKTFFHESTHLFDYNTKIDNPYVWPKTGYIDDKYGISGANRAGLLDTLKREAVAYVNDRLGTNYKSLNGVSRDDAFKFNLMIGRYMDECEQRDKYSAVSDTFGGLSRNKLRGAYSHKTGYWEYWDRGKVGGYQATKEFAAEVGEAYFGGGILEEAMLEVFPEAYNMIVKELEKGVFDEW